MLEKTLIYLGIMEKHLVVLAGSDSIGGQIKNLKCCFNIGSLLSPAKVPVPELERDYLQKRKDDFLITFRKEPNKIGT